MKNSKSFTLIEILVVIAILAGFMALLVPNYMEVRMKSRDVRRKSDIKSIQKALELYAQNQSPVAYPTSLPTPCQPFTDTTGMVFMQKFPQDPLSVCSSNPARYYFMQPTSTPGIKDPNLYVIYACAENKNDPESYSCPADFASVSGSTCVSGKCYQLTQP